MRLLSGILAALLALQVAHSAGITPVAARGAAPHDSSAPAVRALRVLPPNSVALLDARATAIAQAFATDSLGQPWSRWIAARPGASEPFHGGSYLIDRMDYWVWRCVVDREGGRLAAYAYLMRAGGEPTIERVRWTLGPAAGVDTGVVSGLQRHLLRAFSARYGEPTLLTQRQLMDPGSASWRDVLEFRTPAGELRVYREASGDAPGLDSLVVDHASARLRASFGQDMPTGELSDTLDVSVSRVEGVRRVDAALARARSGLAAAVRANASRLADLPAVRGALARAARPGTPPIQRDLLRYAAHLWLGGCDSLPGWSTGDSAAARPVQSALRPFGVRLVRTHDGNWCYDGALAESLALRAGRSPWADLAFLELLDRGWMSPCTLCGWDKPYHADYFVPTVAHGEAYLAAHPRSAIAPLVALRVAEAHETAWSLSKAAADDDYIDARRYLVEAPRHRERALELYMRFLDGQPASVKPALRERLRRMRLDVDTNFHKYWCLWD